MLRLALVLFSLFSAIWLEGCKSYQAPPSNMAAARAAKQVRAELRSNIPKIEPFFSRMAPPSKSDWLASHNEQGQTFEEYLDSDPVRPTAERQKIYILPLGVFSSKQLQIVSTTARYLEAFYDLPVELMSTQQLLAVGSNVRQNKLTKTRQIKTGYIIESILKPALPGDASALVAFTVDDLYPNDSKNYVFGQASLEDRVGVWSLSRMDDNTTAANFLIRTLKIASHEVGHMFSMRHCTKFECVMSGVNHLAETDRRPLDACPECTAKICWLSNVDQAERYDRLAKFSSINGLASESLAFEKKARALR